MLPAAKPSSIPVPTALRPAGQIKVRKRRENGSSASSTSGAQLSTCSGTEYSSLNLTHRRNSPLKAPAQEAPPFIVEPDSPTLHRRKSSKNRVFSRVLGSIQTARSNPALQPTRNGHSDGSIFRKLSMRRRPSFQSRSKSSEFPVQPSSPSLLTLSSSRTTLRPDQPAISPQSDRFQHLSPQGADQASPRPRNAARGSPPILTVDLNVMTELEALSFHEEKCIWVAVEARGVVKTDVRDVRRNEGVGLDVVVILDNSRFASPDSLETACDVALQIAELSTEADDRLAVFCTCCRHFSDQARASGCLLHPLKAVNAASVRREVQDIRALATRPPTTSADVSETLREAINVLGNPTDKTVQPLRLDRCLVFILSPQPLTGLDSEDDFSHIDINAVCTAVIPHYSSTVDNSNVWMLPRTMPSRLSPEVDANDSIHLVAQAADVMSYTRGGRGFGAITDLCLDIKPRSDCVVESLLGNSSSPTLMAGQTISVLIRVRVPALTHDKSTRRDSFSELEDAFRDLEITLGDAVTEILDVTARYRQSCFPKNNVVTVERFCSVRRPNPLSPWSVAVPSNHSEISRIENELSRRFVFLIATQDPPDIALDALATFYQNGHCSLPCSSYVERVRHELTFRLGTTILSTGSSADASASSDPAYSQEHETSLDVLGIHISLQEKEQYSSGLRHYPSQPHLSSEARDNLCPTATDLPISLQSISASPLTDNRRNTPQASPRNPATLGTGNTATTQTGICTSTSDDAESPSVDEARAIWRHMRRNVSIRAAGPSRGTPSWPTGYRSVGQRAEMAREHRERELKRKALANKRSIGADTLRSLAMSSEASGNEAGAAPWLL